MIKVNREEAKDIIITNLDHFLTEGWALRVDLIQAEVLKKCCPEFFQIIKTEYDYTDGRVYRVRFLGKNAIPKEKYIKYLEWKVEELNETISSLLDDHTEVAQILGFA